MGKLGAVFAQIFFAPMIKRGATHDNPTPWIHGVMQIFALFMFLGMLTSLLVPESKRARLEALAGEREDVYDLAAGGWRERRGGAQRGSGGGSVATARSTEGIVREGSAAGDVEKGKWWRFRQTEVHPHAV